MVKAKKVTWWPNNSRHLAPSDTYLEKHVYEADRVLRGVCLRSTVKLGVKR